MPYVNIFEKDFFEAIQQYIRNPSVIILSPVHYILVANLNILFGSFLITKIFYILLCSILPLIFYKILKKKINISHDLLWYVRGIQITLVAPVVPPDTPDPVRPFRQEASPARSGRRLRAAVPRVRHEAVP